MRVPPTPLFPALCLTMAAVLGAAAQGLPEGNPEHGRAIAAGAFAAGAAGACQACHGIDGAGDGAAGFPSLSGMPREYLAKSLADYASGRRSNEIMTPIAKALTEDGIVDVATFYAGTTGEMTALEALADPERIQRGGILSAIGDAGLGVQACQNCHGPTGRGMGYQYPPLAGQSSVYLAAQLRAWQSGTRAGDTHHVMREIARRLTDADIEAVAAYFASLPRNPDAAVRGTDWRPAP